MKKEHKVRKPTVKETEPLNEEIKELLCMTKENQNSVEIEFVPNNSRTIKILPKSNEEKMFSKTEAENQDKFSKCGSRFEVSYQTLVQGI